MDNLSKINKENPFKIPDGYFDKFPLQMQEKINNTAISNTKLNSRFKLQPYLAYAAVFSGLIISVYFTFDYINNQKIKQNTLTAKTTIEADFSVDYSINENYIVDAMVSSENTNEEESYNSDDIENYLADNEIETNLVIDAY